jgi:hypothetical protein
MPMLMVRARSTTLLGVGLLLFIAAALSACGASGETRTVVVTTTVPVAEAATKAPKRKTARHEPKRSPKARIALATCDANIRVRSPRTTCGFAQNVFYGYWLNDYEPGVFADSAGIPAYSPAAAAMFTVRCSGASKIVCRAGDGGYVTFPVRAVTAYTLVNAVDYAATHELGDVPAPSIPDEPSDPAPSDPGGDCHPSYEGACLDPNSIDYDCENGSGDGPDYTGPVRVVSDDPYDLDRDGNGIACDW